MRDARLEREFFTVGEQERAITVARRCETAEWFGDVVKTVSRWYLDTVAPVALPDGEAPVLALDDNLRAALLAIPGIPADLTRRLEVWMGTYYGHEEDTEAGWVWGTALATAGLTCLDQPAVFASTWRSAARLTISGEAYLSCLAAALSGADGTALMVYMHDIATRLSTLDGCWVPGDDRRRNDAVRAFMRWWDGATLFSVWEDHSLQQFPITCDEAWLLGAVRRADRHRYLGLLDESRNLPVIQAAFSEISDDVDELLALLAAAPTACGPLALGARACEWNQKLTAPVLLGMIYEHADRLAHVLNRRDQSSGEASELAQYVTQEVPALWTRTMQTVLARDDGLFLAVHWLVHLCRDLGRISMAERADLRTVTQQSVSHELASYGVAEEAMRAHFPAVFDISREEAYSLLREGRECGDPDPQGVAVLLALLSLVIQPDPPSISSSDADALLTILIGLLAQRHPALSQHLDASPEAWRQARADSTIVSWRHAHVARLFAMQADPIRVWQDVWFSLEEQRRRLFYPEYTRDWTADDPSVFVMYAGLALLNSLHQVGRSSGAAWHDLWELLYDAALSLLLRLRPGPRFSRWVRAVALLVACLPMYLDAVSPETMADQITAAMKRVGGDDAAILECVVELARSGVSAAWIAAIVAGTGTPLDQIVARYDAFIGPPGPGPHILPAQRIIRECKSLLAGNA